MDDNLIWAARCAPRHLLDSASVLAIALADEAYGRTHGAVVWAGRMACKNPYTEAAVNTERSTQEEAAGAATSAWDAAFIAAADPIRWARLAEAAVPVRAAAASDADDASWAIVWAEFETAVQRICA